MAGTTLTSKRENRDVLLRESAPARHTHWAKLKSVTNRFRSHVLVARSADAGPATMPHNSVRDLFREVSDQITAFWCATIGPNFLTPSRHQSRSRCGSVCHSSSFARQGACASPSLILLHQHVHRIWPPSIGHRLRERSLGM